MSDQQRDRRLRAEITVTAGADVLGPFALPLHSVADIGRSPGCAIQMTPPWAPRRLASLAPVDGGWLLTNGDRTRVTAVSRSVRNGVFERGAKVFLQPGHWRLSWELDGPCVANIRITSAPTDAPEHLPYALNDLQAEPAVRRARMTAIAGSEMALSPMTRHRLAVLFSHEFDDAAPPDNVCKAAAQRLGVTEAQVKRTALRVRDRLNARRELPLESLEQLGYYLVHVSGALSPDDLEP